MFRSISYTLQTTLQDTGFATDIPNPTMAPSAIPVESEDVSHLPLKLGGKENGTNGTKHVEDVQMMESQEKTQHVLASFRCLIADLCQQFGMGHPG